MNKLERTMKVLEIVGWAVLGAVTTLAIQHVVAAQNAIPAWVGW